MVDTEKLKKEIEGLSDKEACEYLYGGLPKKTIQFIDRVRLNKKTKFPETMRIEEGYISAINHRVDDSSPGNKQYFIVELAVAFHSDWKSIEVWMTVEELNELLKKQKNQKVENFIEVFMNRPTYYPGIPIREVLKTYLHCKGIDIELIQVKDQEVPAEHQKSYCTRRLFEFFKLKEQPEKRWLNSIRLPKYTIQFIDRVRLNKKAKYPERMKCNEGYISSIFLEHDSGIPSKLQYFRVKIAVAFNSGWKYLDVKMTVEELKEIFKKSTNQELGNLFEENYKKVQGKPTNKKPSASFRRYYLIREWFKTYLHCKDLDIEVLQIIDEEIPAKQRKFYWTERFLEYYTLIMYCSPNKKAS